MRSKQRDENLSAEQTRTLLGATNIMLDSVLTRLNRISHDDETYKKEILNIKRILQKDIVPKLATQPAEEILREAGDAVTINGSVTADHGSTVIINNGTSQQDQKSQ